MYRLQKISPRRSARVTGRMGGPDSEMQFRVPRGTAHSIPRFNSSSRHHLQVLLEPPSPSSGCFSSPARTTLPHTWRLLKQLRSTLIVRKTSAPSWLLRPPWPRRLILWAPEEFWESTFCRRWGGKRRSPSPSLHTELVLGQWHLRSASARGSQGYRNLHGERISSSARSARTSLFC